MKTAPTLPSPSEEALKDSKLLITQIKNEIIKNGPITFARFMELALYAPQFGYYRSGLTKFGQEGDFITAPMISPLFSRCIARQCGQILSQLPQKGNILEFGPGSGEMAVQIIKELAHQNNLPHRYQMLELSSELIQRQQNFVNTYTPQFFHLFEWITSIPPYPFQGVILANEVIDAFPVHRFCFQQNELFEHYVDFDNDQLLWKLGPPSSPHLHDAIMNLEIELKQNFAETGYNSEINLILSGWIGTLSDILATGLILMIDYGFPRHEFYHPQRDQGTIMSHFQHLAHPNPLLYPGLQDITSHVDFTAIAMAASHHQLEISGFIHQAGFLINCGIEKLIPENLNEVNQYNLSQSIKRLTHPNEMGEIFKVIALTRNFPDTLLGFTHFNQKARL